MFSFQNRVTIKYIVPFFFQEFHTYGCHPEIVVVWVRFLSDLIV